MGTILDNKRTKNFVDTRSSIISGSSLTMGLVSLWSNSNCRTSRSSFLFVGLIIFILCYVGISIYGSQQALPTNHYLQQQHHDHYYYRYGTNSTTTATSSSTSIQQLSSLQEQQQQLQSTKNNNNNNNNIKVDSRETNSEILTVDREEYYKNMNDDGISIGVLSKQPVSFFRNIQNEIDNEDNMIRCQRYGGYYNNSNPKTKNRRRIFYGALIASEPWELFEIISAETYGIYTGIVLVEGNRTQNFTPRKFLRYDPNNNRSLYIKKTIQQLFNVSKVQIRQFVHEDPKLINLNREHYQRNEIIKGWKELGMTVDDIGLLADFDETFTRDFLRAVQICDGFDIFDYNKHHCYYKLIKITGSSRVFESSPECITQKREWRHPDMILGYCIEGINDNGQHPIAVRGDNNNDNDNNNNTSGGELYPYLRQYGYGRKCRDWYYDNSNVNFTNHSLWNAADIRRPCGGQIYHLKKINKVVVPNNNNTDNNQTTSIVQQQQQIVLLDYYTGYHFHNFFNEFNDTRFKYYTYGHADPNVNIKPIYNISNNLNMMYQCIKNNTPTIKQLWKHTIGGYNAIQPFYPIYFQDPDYRQRRHQHVQKMIYDDEILLNKLLLQQQ